MHDTLVIVSDNPVFFNYELYSIPTKRKARNVYGGYHVDFDDDIPIRFVATFSSDTLVYEKVPVRSAPYQLSKGVLRTNRLAKFPLRVGRSVKALCEEAKISECLSSVTLFKYSKIIIIRPGGVRSSWVYDLLTELPIVSTKGGNMIILEIEDGRIKSIDFSNFGKHNMVEGISVTRFFLWK